ncbi:unnamed protein product [Thlaspi arvense]|uniref:Uncharacterized protein n=1 Tax=Thlaspi arvense TaxID=13288 RepID=A0AAU9SEI4_THLAR|nr:unnamed protein product [Thlaspi arvense]
MVTDNHREDGEEEKMLLLSENEVDGASELQMYRIHSIEATVLIRQLPSQGISFKLWLPATTLVTLLDNYRRDPSSSPLTRTLSNFRSDGSDSSRLNIVELGSGTGIVGIAAAATLGANVTLTDLPNVIENLKFNADANAEVVARLGGNIHVAPLRWGEAADVEALGQSVDLILASDVVYHEHLYDPLLKTLRFMLLEGDDKDAKRVLLMAHLKRWKKESIFFKKARKFFDVEAIHRDDPQEGSRTGVVVCTENDEVSRKERTKEEMTLGLLNANPVVQAKKERLVRTQDQYRNCGVDPLDIYDILSSISVWITFTPTIQHCSMANLIGLCLRAKLRECLPLHYKIDIKVSPGSHADEDSGEVIYAVAVNKQLNDKERVIAALENPNLRQLVDECIVVSSEM